MTTFRRPPTAQEAVLGELRREILEGELRPGSRIPQEAVAQRLGVSRVPVREALKTLEGQGLVSYLPRRGYLVTLLDYGELAEIYAARRLLEAEAVRLAMRQMTPERAGTLRAALADWDRVAAGADLAALQAANRRYHFSLFEACGSRVLLRLIAGLWDTSEPYRFLYLAGTETREVSQSEHREILAAVQDGDADRVLKVVHRHRDHALDDLAVVLSG